ncbi:MAG TPA: hypothetical protein DEF47_02895 [Herpetosiphon sp.]|uniref:Glycosyl transferase family 39 n=1 Tax=Herpetosiphon aurantiacus (strain ATCC 23779 / DSM 785 / 114-95) TaxID=316274 RepID=A9B647_HERA2|nr:glycosyltransferase family 39 protein [Herpetosiphon sp.]ABX06258.1 glycosyl transferase family 39 [Herpetosiphon aurantiacus DSM 785]HBW48838.1 hypothetical protein [Herpetosiphon sp.]
MSASTTTSNLRRPLAWRIAQLTRSQALVLLSIILLCAGWLRLQNFAAVAEGNTYYTAATVAMTQSWHNFFFAAAEPGGSVTIDKPALGLWIQAIFGKLFGVSGTVVVLPQVLAGLATIGLLYWIVARRWGRSAGLLAAAIQAISPISIAVERTNNLDALLIVTLVGAMALFLVATERASTKYLLLAGAVVGLGFNIKMLQAFLPLPAFYAMYFFAAKTGWWRKLWQLGLTTPVLLAVSFSWAIAVDLVPASERPYIGSSDTNSVVNLILGYNGVERLTGREGQAMGGAIPTTDDRQRPNATDGNAQMPAMPNGNAQTPPNGMTDEGMRGQFGGQTGRTGGGGPGMDSGESGLFRMFSSPMNTNIGWLLGAALFAVVGLAAHYIKQRRWPDADVWGWAGWLVTAFVVLSFAGFSHGYYSATIAPAIAGTLAIGITVWRRSASKIVGLWLIGLVAAALVVQVIAAQPSVSGWLIPSVALGLALVAAGLAFRASWRVAATAVGIAAILLIPSEWAYKTSAMEQMNTTLPSAAAPTDNATGFAAGFAGNRNRSDSSSPSALATYLQERTSDTYYMLAVPSSMMGSSLVIETGRPVLMMGGFSGSDPVIDAADIAQLVADGKLRYIMTGGMGGAGRGGSSTVQTWVQQNCTAVTDAPNSQAGFDLPNGQMPNAQAAPTNGNTGGAQFAQNNSSLYRCGE